MSFMSSDVIHCLTRSIGYAVMLVELSHQSIQRLGGGRGGVKPDGTKLRAEGSDYHRAPPKTCHCGICLEYR